MILSIVPVVQVVASGTDWPAIASGVAAGIVGFAGIAATYMQGKRSQRVQSDDLRASLDATAKNLQTSIGADNERAELAARRRLYGHCMGTFLLATDSARLARLHSTDPLDRFSAAYNSALVSALSAIYEVILSAPPEVGDLASEALGNLMALRSGAEDSDRKCVNAQVDLLAAMRKDLGELIRLTPPRSRSPE